MRGLLETLVIAQIFCAAWLEMFVKQPRLEICSSFAATLFCFLSIVVQHKLVIVIAPCDEAQLDLCKKSL